MTQESVIIGEHHLVFNGMPFKRARKVNNRLMKLVGIYADDEVQEIGLGLFRFAGMAGVITDDDIDFFCEEYGACTDIVHPGTSKAPQLFNAQWQETAFKGNLPLMYQWLDLATEFHFGADLKDYADAQKKMAEKVRARAGSKTP